MEEKTAQTENPIIQQINPVIAPSNGTNNPFVPQKTLVLIGVLALITIILLVFALHIGFPGNKTVNQASVPVLKTTLGISKPVASSSIYTANVWLTTEREKVTAVDIELTYDPKILTNVDVKPGSFFPNPTVLRQTIDKINGKVSFILGIGLGDSPVNGNGTVAILSFTTLTKSGVTTISFLKESGVTVSTIRPSILTNAQGVQFPFGPTPTP